MLNARKAMASKICLLTACRILGVLQTFRIMEEWQILSDQMQLLEINFKRLGMLLIFKGPEGIFFSEGKQKYYFIILSLFQKIIFLGT